MQILLPQTQTTRSFPKLCKTQREKSSRSLQAKVDFISAVVTKWTYETLGMKGHRKKAGGRLAKTELLVNVITRRAGNEETIILEGLLHSGLGNRTWTGGGNVVSSRRKEREHLYDNTVGAQEQKYRRSHIWDGSDNLGGVFQCVHLKRCHNPVEDTDCCYTLQDWYFKTQPQICFKY